MMGGLSEREQKLIAVGLLTALIAIIWLLVGAPVVQGFETRRDRREAASLQFAQDARRLEQAPRARAQLIQARAVAAPFLLQAATAPLALNQARARVVQAAAAEGVAIERLGGAPSASGAVRLEVVVRGSFPRLSALVRRLETAPAAALVTGLSLERSTSGVAEGQAPGQVEAQLSLEFGYGASR